ncbi:hypothetical protein NLU13_5475 [Sarocladium strictum]|uniref:Uncharacterized protein n=1 Tax=Sarocladium strictum TaxID=5046 RepID=A0AA39GJF9_SARSR|nr:hypothetical protein NLU13_5475 [Sarocladium strictum]
MSQVKNLRAMFENKGDDSSPPDRGRSPGPSGTVTPSASFTGSPRPLSRIRSSFVAIEKDGRMGLQRAPSDEGSLPRRRMSGDTDAESISAMSDIKSTTTTGDDSVKPARRIFINDPIPESPRLPNDLDGSSQNIGAVTDQPSVNPDKQIDEEQPSKSLLPGDPTTATAVPTKTVNGKTKTTEAASAPSKSAASTATKKTTVRPSAISTKPTIKATVPAKSPATVKTPTSATSTTAPRTTARTTARTAPKKDTTSIATKPTSSTTTKVTSSSATKKPAPLKPSSSGTGFVKPKVKSPTKPVSLPPSLMAQTASSGAKGNASRPSLTAQTGNAQARTSSRASGTMGASKFPKAPVSKHPRPSIGPPPKRNNQERPVTRDSNVDEGFLARMMRPTASSAQKTAEKAQLTPPKRTAGRPSTTSSRRESSVRSSSRAKTPSVHASESADDHKHQPSSIDEIAVATAIVETVEEAAEPAHEADLAPPAEELPTAATATETAVVADETAANQVPVTNPEPEVVIEPSEHADDDAVLETAAVETANQAAEVDQVQAPAEAEAGHATDDATAVEDVAVEEAAVEAANVETAEEATAIAEEASLVQGPIEPETAEPEVPKEDETALKTANVETVEEAAAIAEEADLVEDPAEAKDFSNTAEEKTGQFAMESEPTAGASIAEPATTEAKPNTPGSPFDSDIDSLADKLAETRIEANDEKEKDEEAKETR